MRIPRVVAALALLSLPLAAQPAPPKSPAEACPVTGACLPGLEGLDACMRKFMESNDVPGGVLAVTKGGRLVYERAFGFADVDKREPTRPASRFRLASVSKPITAVAVLGLVERGKLQLSDKVYDLLAPKPFGERELDPRFKDITILHLLQHRGGFDRDKSFDPMFRSYLVSAEAGHDGPASAADVIRYMAGRRLDFDPGARYAYSNFGYCLLGRVIEKVTGRPYDEYVKRTICKPLGIESFGLGATRAKDRLPDEVVYYARTKAKARSVFPTEPKTSWAYGGFYLEPMDSHGAWVASARDLLRFARDFDDPKSSRLLAPGSIATMFARPEGTAGIGKDGKPRRSWYACGWAVVAGKEQNHGGSLPGTTTRLVRRADGIDWVVLFNTRRDRRRVRIRPDRVHATISRFLGCVKDWPTGDLFEGTGPK